MNYGTFGDEASFNLFGADLTKYDGIVVWHSTYVESVLVLSMIASCYEGKIYHIDVSKSFKNQRCGELMGEQLFSCLNSCRELSLRQKTALKLKYDELPHDRAYIKKYVRHNFEIVNKEVLKKKLLR